VNNPGRNTLSSGALLYPGIVTHTMSRNSIVNISGYRFVRLQNLRQLQAKCKDTLSLVGVKGSVVLATEGINISLAGTYSQVEAAISFFNTQSYLADIWYKYSFSEQVPHRRLRIRIRTEIISFDDRRADELRTQRPAAPTLSPENVDHWLDTGRNLMLLDARNDYEIVSGTFKQAKHLNIKHFKHFKDAATQAVADGWLSKDCPVVTFCTGGIRCEKAAPWLLANGFSEVYQIEGGVINYLQNTSADHWQGDCFVFDERVELDRELNPTGAGLCDHCQLAVPAGSECQCQLGPHFHSSETNVE
jgi:UPF0176 protein